MAEINEIVSKAAIDDIIRLNESFIKLDSNMSKILNNSKTLTDQLNKTAQSTANTEQKAKEYNVILDQTAANQKELVSQQKQLETSQAKLNTIQSDTNQELLKYKRQIAEENELLKLNTIMTDKNSGTLEKAAAYNRVLEKEKKKLDLTTKEGTARLKEINEQQDKNNELIAVGANKLQAQKINIGNYKSALDDLKSGFISGEKSAKQMASGVAQVGKQLIKAFITNPILLIIGGIAGAVMLIVNAIKRSQSASDQFAKIWGGFKNVISELTSRVFEFIGGLGKLLTGNFKEGVAKIKDSFTDLGSSIKEAYNEGSKLVELQQNLDKATIKNIESNAKLTAEIEKQTAIADDATLSFKVRQQASERAGKLLIEQAKLNLDLANQEVSIANEKYKIAESQGTLNRDIERELAEVTAKKIEAESNYNKQVFDNAKQQRELKSDLFEKDLDILIDGFDKQKTINEQKLQDERLTFQEKQKILDETKNLSIISFDEQIKTVEKFTNTKLDSNDLINTSDAKQLNEKIRALGLSEIYEGRLLEIVNERKIAIQDFAVDQQDIDKAELERKNKLIEADKKAADEAIKAEKEKIDKINALNELKYLQQVAIIKATSKTEDEANDKIAKLDEANLKAFIDNTDKMLQSANVSAEIRLELEKQIADSKIKLSDAVLEREKANTEKATELRKSAFESSVQVANALFDFMGSRYNDELTLLEQKNQQGLLSDKEYAQQKAEIEIKQAKAKKLQGAFETTINTAAAIVGMLKDPGGVAGTIMAVAAGITGGLQLASILSAPLPTIPAFAEGTTNAPALGLAGEAGTELGITKTGEAILFDKPTVFKGAKFKGMHIYSNPEFEAMKAMNNFNYVSDNTAIVSKLESLEKTIKDKPVFIFDKDKNIVGMMKSNHIERYINRYK